jgi:aminopeptidase N
MANATEEDFDFIYKHYKDAPLNEEKLQLSKTFGDYLATLKSTNNIKKGVEAMMVFRNIIPDEFKGFTDPFFKQAFEKIAKAKEGTDKALADYLRGLVK